MRSGREEENSESREGTIVNTEDAIESNEEGGIRSKRERDSEYREELGRSKRERNKEDEIVRSKRGREEEYSKEKGRSKRERREDVKLGETTERGASGVLNSNKKGGGEDGSTVEKEEGKEDKNLGYIDKVGNEWKEYSNQKVIENDLEWDGGYSYQNGIKLWIDKEDELKRGKNKIY